MRNIIKNKAKNFLHLFLKLKYPIKNIWAEYYLIFLFIVLFVFKTHIFNLWTNLELTFLIRRTITAIGMALLLVAPTFTLQKKKRYFYLLFITGITSLIFTSEYIYNSYGNGIFSISALKYFFQLEPVANIVWKLVSFKTLFFCIDFFILLTFFKKIVKQYSKINATNQFRFKNNFFYLSIIFGVIFSSYVVIKEKSIRYLAIPIDSSVVIQKTGIINYAIQDTIKYFFTKRKITLEEISQIEEWNKKRKIESNEPKIYQGIAKNKNVIVIQLEAFSDFLINLKIDDQEITPNLNKLAKDGYRFTNFYYQSGPGTTSDAEFTSLNSLLFLSNRSVYFDYPDNNYYALPRFLSENNYNPIAMHGYRKEFWNRSVIYPNLGFKRFYNSDDYIIKDPIGWGLSDNDFLDQSVDIMKNVKKPFFSFLLTLSTHSPFNIPEDKKELKINKDEFGGLMTDYFHATHYTDKAIGNFIEKLKESGLYEDSMIVFYGDHEGYLEPMNNPGFRKLLNIPEENKNNHLTHIELQRVPFIINIPGKPNFNGIMESPSSQFDFYPTITNLLGFEKPKTTLGKDTFNSKNHLVIFRRNTPINGSFMADELYYQTSINKIPEKGYCYNLKEKKKIENKKCLEKYNEINELSNINDLIIYGNKLDILK